MSTADIQILIFSLNDVLDPNQTILSFGIIFANQYHLPVPNRIIRNRGKKPRFDNEGVYFSVSHSGKYWICAFSDMPIGVDIQQHKTCKKFAETF